MGSQHGACMLGNAQCEKLMAAHRFAGAHLRADEAQRRDSGTARLMQAMRDQLAVSHIVMAPRV